MAMSSVKKYGYILGIRQGGRGEVSGPVAIILVEANDETTAYNEALHLAAKFIANKKAMEVLAHPERYTEPSPVLNELPVLL